MGGMCGKPSGIDAGRKTSTSPEKKPAAAARVSSEPRSRRVESFRVKNRGEIRTGSIDKRLNSSRRVRDDHYDNNNNNNSYKGSRDREVSETFIANIPGFGAIPKGVEGELIVAGWPSWLVDVASEAIDGMLPRRAETFEKLEKV